MKLGLQLTWHFKKERKKGRNKNSEIKDTMQLVKVRNLLFFSKKN
jgi:hypothetical protein